MKHFVSLISLIITMAVGVITLLTYFAPILVNVRYLFVEWAVIVAAFAMLLGLFNLFHVHATRIIRWQGGFYSLVLLVSALLVLLASVWDILQSGSQALDPTLAQHGMAGSAMTGVYKYVLIPIQSSLAALLPFFLGFAAYRALRMRSTRGAVGAAVFSITAIVVLLGQAPLFNQTWLRDVRDAVVRVLATAGMRGILLGVALGVTATALRVLIGVDRPSSD